MRIRHSTPPAKARQLIAGKKRFENDRIKFYR